MGKEQAERIEIETKETPVLDGDDMFSFSMIAIEELENVQIARDHIEKASKQIQDPFVQEDYEKGIVKPPYNQKTLAQAILKNAWFKTCINGKVSSGFEVGYDFELAEEFKDQPDDDKEKALANEIFRNPNATETFQEVMKRVMTDYESTGNGYLEISKNGEGQVDGFYHIPSHTARVSKDKKAVVQIRDNIKMYFRAYGIETGEECEALGRKMVPDSETGYWENEVIHFKNYSPLDDFYGVPDALSAWFAFVGDTYAVKYNMQFFENNAVPQYIVTITGGKVTRRARETIMRYFRQEIKGGSHKTLVIPLPHGMKAEFKAVSEYSSMKDAHFVSYRKMNREEICAVMRVPPSEAGIWESAIKANSYVQSKNFITKVVQPLQHKVSHKLNKILRDSGIIRYEFVWSYVDPEDEKMRAELDGAVATVESSKAGTLIQLMTNGLIFEDEAREVLKGFKLFEGIELKGLGLEDDKEGKAIEAKLDAEGEVVSDSGKTEPEAGGETLVVKSKIIRRNGPYYNRIVADFLQKSAELREYLSGEQELPNALEHLDAGADKQGQFVMVHKSICELAGDPWKPDEIGCTCGYEHSEE